MDQELVTSLLESSNKTSGIFSDFMARIAKFEELVDIAHRLLTEFHQELEIFRRPPLHQISKVAGDIIKANYTDRMKAYVEAGYKHVSCDIQTISKLHCCKQGLQDHMKKVKVLLNELECLMKDATGIMQTEDQSILDLFGGKCGDDMTDQVLLFEEEETEPELVHLQDRSILNTTMMTVVYRMLTLEYDMQERIVQSLSLNTSSSELESYCLMWDLRPYVNDSIMQISWKLAQVNQSQSDNQISYSVFR